MTLQLANTGPASPGPFTRNATVQDVNALKQDPHISNAVKHAAAMQQCILTVTGKQQ
jgi:hypothetical protein